MTIVILSQPRAEPIRLADARRWLGMTDDNDTDQDAEIEVLIAAMRRHAENLTGRAFVDRELELNLDCFPRVIELPIAPVVAIDYIRYKDADGELQTLYAEGSPATGEDLVEFDLKRSPARIQPADGRSWPTIGGQYFNPVQIGFTAGYGTGGSPEDLSVIPQELALWMRARIATLFENRENLIVGTIVNELPRSNYDALLDGLILGRRIG